MASSQSRRERKLKEKYREKFHQQLKSRVEIEAAKDPFWAKKTHAARTLLEGALKEEHPTRDLLRMQASLDNLLKEKKLL